MPVSPYVPHTTKAPEFPVTEYFYFPCRKPTCMADWRNVWDFCHNEERRRDYAETYGQDATKALLKEQRALLDTYPTIRGRVVVIDKNTYEYYPPRDRRSAKKKAEDTAREKARAERYERERVAAQALAVVVEPPGYERPVLPNGVVMCFGHEVEGSATFLDGRPAR